MNELIFKLILQIFIDLMSTKSLLKLLSNDSERIYADPTYQLMDTEKNKNYW